MTRAQATREYVDWMLSKVCEDKRKIDDYMELFLYLYNYRFEWIHPMDSNRQEDGEALRYQFGRENGYPDPMIASLLDDRPCSILEMMVALAIRCEDRFAYDPDVGNRTGVWFWEMIESLGLSRMNNCNFDIDHADMIIDRFLKRKYEPNGKGGLFTLKRPMKDMRHVDIWYQMCYYLNEVL